VRSETGGGGGRRGLLWGSIPLASLSEVESARDLKGGKKTDPGTKVRRNN